MANWVYANTSSNTFSFPSANEESKSLKVKLTFQCDLDTLTLTSGDFKIEATILDAYDNETSLPEAEADNGIWLYCNYKEDDINSSFMLKKHLVCLKGASNSTWETPIITVKKNYNSSSFKLPTFMLCNTQTFVVDPSEKVIIALTENGEEWRESFDTGYVAGSRPKTEIFPEETEESEETKEFAITSYSTNKMYSFPDTESPCDITIADLKRNNYFYELKPVTYSIYTAEGSTVEKDIVVSFNCNLYAAQKVINADGSETFEILKKSDGTNNLITNQIFSNVKSYSKYFELTDFEEYDKKIGWYLVKLTVEFEDNIVAQAEIPIKNYVAPIKAYYPYEESGRLEGPSSNTKPNDGVWKFKWQHAEPGNDSSDITGYRVRLYCSTEKVPFLIRRANGALENKYTKVEDNNKITDIFYDFYITPEDCDEKNVLLEVLLDINTNVFNPNIGDKIKFAIIPFVSMPALTANEIERLESFNIVLDDEYKEEQLLFLPTNSELDYSSPTYVVSNADHLKVKTSSGWKPGRVFVYMDEDAKAGEDLNSNGEWIQATALYVKTNDGWGTAQ